MFHVKHKGGETMQYSFRAIHDKLILNQQIYYIKGGTTNKEKYHRYVESLRLFHEMHYFEQISIKVLKYMELKALNAYIQSID